LFVFLLSMITPEFRDPTFNSWYYNVFSHLEESLTPPGCHTRHPTIGRALLSLQKMCALTDGVGFRELIS
jgi:hypothetical protein